MKQKQCVYVETQSYSVGVHYYAYLVGNLNGKYTKIQIEYAVTAAQAQRFNVYDRGSFDWEKGQTTGRFWSEENAKDKAVEVFKQHFPDADILIHGSSSYLEPQEVLVGPKKYKEEVNKLFEQSKALGWDAWKDSAKEMQELCNQWQALNTKYNVKR